MPIPPVLQNIKYIFLKGNRKGRGVSGAHQSTSMTKAILAKYYQKFDDFSKYFQQNNDHFKGFSKKYIKKLRNCFKILKY
jgi:hypothetical protein